MNISPHVNPETVSSFIDGELAPDTAHAVEQHLGVCPNCALQVLSATRLKTAVAHAGQRFAPAPGVLARLTRQLQPEQAEPKPTLGRLYILRKPAWVTLAAILLLAISLITLQQRRASNSLDAELLDQHLATLATGAAPEVISSDRHTVKPWFQDKLPFSFNLPEPTQLPPDTVLKGADFTYLEGKPAALLLFTIHQHQVSVFVTQRDSMLGISPFAARSGFTIRSTTAPGLRLTAVSNVSPSDLDLLLSTLDRAQEGS